MNRVFEILFTETWWAYDPGDRSAHSIFTHWFNLFEGVAWLVFAALVFRRYLRFRRSLVEVVYAATFVVFGLTDFREAYSLPSWLLWIKLFVLIALLLLRRSVMRRFYPKSKVF
ncbi:MAG: hypothetical protein HY290_25930 [Planctomycetia bacterium]|nr:hypothetical protein [Planctomycetia bacterium]